MANVTKPLTSNRTYSIMLSCGAAIIAADQWTKQLALENLTHEGDVRPFLGWWNFTLVYNHAAAFGIFGGVPDSVRKAFFIALPLVVLGLLWWFYGRKLRTDDKLGPVAMGLVLGGALGNLVDRVRYGYVVDFIDWFYRSTGECLPQFHKFSSNTCNWPVFNVADSAITIAMVLLIVQSLFQKETAKR